MAVDPTSTTLRIERPTKERLRMWAQRGGVSTSYLLDELVRHVEVTSDGMPTWLPAADREGELPIYDE